MAASLAPVAHSARSSVNAGTVSSSASGAASAAALLATPSAPPCASNDFRPAGDAPGRSSATSASIAAASRHTDRINAAAREKSARAALVVALATTSETFASSSSPSSRVEAVWSTKPPRPEPLSSSSGLATSAFSGRAKGAFSPRVFFAPSAPLPSSRFRWEGAYPRSQGAPLSASAADGRSSGSTVSRLSMRRLKRRGVAAGGFKIAGISPACSARHAVPSSNAGGVPARMVSNVTPMDHTSLFAPCLLPCLKHSGAPKNLVPTKPTSSRVFPRANAAPPKSTSTALGSAPFSHGRFSITFSGLMSR
mmetsp:Transcript_4922/g.20920  ORF Transcript_4922/g.20920 Transcript_4922/m.20920 type:complete len:309 (-) Transcript_4922:549-1475(-)